MSYIVLRRHCRDIYDLLIYDCTFSQLELIKNESANKQLKYAADKDLDERTFRVLLLTKIEKLQERIQLLECTCEE